MSNQATHRNAIIGLTPEELAAEEVTALPDKEVVSILDLNVDVDLARLVLPLQERLDRPLCCLRILTWKNLLQISFECA